jgi:hypothetical protein
MIHGADTQDSRPPRHREVLVAPHVLCYQRAPHGDFGITDLLHFSFPLTIYILANLLIDWR